MATRPPLEQESPAGTNLFSLDTSPLGGGGGYSPFLLPSHRQPIRVEQAERRETFGQAFEGPFEVP